MPLAADAVAALTAKDLTLATAEATTGGLVGHLLTEIPGSSRVFRGGVAPYGNAMKRAIGVPAGLLAEHGAVSREAAEALARGPRVGGRGHRPGGDGNRRAGPSTVRCGGRSG
jgi:PncC family amidohydrolase